MHPYPLRGNDTRDEAASLAGVLVEAGRRAGLVSVGTAPVAVFTAARGHLERRKRHGLHGGMQFTYRNPARSTDPSRLLAGARSLVVGAWAYAAPRSGPPARSEDRFGGATLHPRGRVARYAVRDHYRDLAAALQVVAAVLTAAGWRARVVVDDNGLVDREAARQAGVGTYGKNTLLLVPGYGSWCLIGTVVTDAPLGVRWSADSGDGARPRRSEHGCGRCTACLDACPTGALVAPGVLDARRCLAWLLQARGTFPLALRTALGDRLYGCDTCQEVCPVNRVAGWRSAREGSSGGSPSGGSPSHAPGSVAAGSTVADVGDLPVTADVDLVELLEAPDEVVMARVGRWYVADRDPAVVRRNALVVLGNVGRADDPAVRRVVTFYCDHPDPVLREHAEWAARRLGLAGAPAAGTPPPGIPVPLGAIGRPDRSAGVGAA
ncbi:MAG: epoxyqueuosine reductase [Acidimicrobiales bacterium]